ncbi:YhfX family PLP-dependent enzyme [Xenorhabdus bovienii]|uniref:YhfX family PLP-dependent enzyme n=1 Tax=Xenorhabdus bovienii TaxID=40576 RepID=A0AAJ1N1N1_XENBV|nr:YhfX family PLP-dependent enzyme [Xenorhabdus bovienii]MDE1479157.1 YhfX family PLP-dependent enzyme [Xenorhabdus bovienii]MDE1487443.1 YhfX family PLP-dependent enzyme [Xenorhabdus bovienii]MDE1496037.1 YhfX family PLP-dependent enzyme [Xenorhabdus bovienii]MDE9443096.1 YhfX family PLP-dependent enzyme [Xenorhabdus bovienii]MDE9458574.1 YhfX family PLP-dependent enzyme [Xenorhabdus bovienii]
MFINALKKQNPKLIEIAKDLWQQGAILPDTYIIDVDQVLDNGRRLLQAAEQYGIELYLMTKQIGRNPWLAQKLIELGYPGVVAVDFREAYTLGQHGIPLCHIGHLVQTPAHLIETMLKQHPGIITVFSIEKAQAISDAAEKLGRVQPIMLKVFDKRDITLPSQEAGILFDELDTTVDVLKTMPGIKLSGLTHFPCLEWNARYQTTLPTINLQTLLRARNRLEQLGIELSQINAPSASSCNTIPLLAKYGATHLEPGHALTGTIPANISGREPEKISMVYITEVSHHYDGNSYCYGGGYYKRGHMKYALVFPEHARSPKTVRVLSLGDPCIDYHIPISGIHPIGSPVIMCFRTQIFVTRSDVALVSGIQSGSPRLEGIYDSQGNWKNRGYFQ